jgi:homoserine dehydrogenase
MTLLQAAAPGTVELHGHGLVGQALAQRCIGAGIPLRAVHTSRGLLQGRAGPCAVLVDATPPRYEGTQAEEWIALLEQRLAAGTHVVTCNKAPLALAWSRLRAAAVAGNATLACSATVGGGTPVLAWVRRLRRSHGLVRLEATLSGTLSFVLPRVQQGASVEDAVREAQARGLAEPDPRLDLDGTDARAKGVLLHNAAFGGALTLRDAGPALRLDEASVRAAAGAGEEAAAIVRVANGSVRLGLEGVPSRGHSPGTVFVRGVLADGNAVELAGPGAGALATAGALLADLDEVLAGRTPPGVWP